MSRTLRIAMITGITAAGVFGVSGVALADDAHPVCDQTVVCSGNILDVHDVTTTLDNVTVSLLGR